MQKPYHIKVGLQEYCEKFGDWIIRNHDIGKNKGQKRAGEYVADLLTFKMLHVYYTYNI